MGSEATTILMFHRVIPNMPVAFGLPDSYRIRGTAMTAEEFEHALDAAGPTLPLAAVEAALTNGEAPPGGAVLTFDDGYREHLEVVAPMLAARAATGTFYVTTGVNGSAANPAAVDAWYWLLDHAERADVSIPLPNGEIFSDRLDTLAGKTAWVTGAPKAALLSSSAAQQRQLLLALADAVGAQVPPSLAHALYLRPAEWGALARCGMRVGAHSVSHPRLDQVTDEALEAEVSTSIREIRRVGEPVSFAYPDGALDARVLDAVRRCGASSAVTCRNGQVHPGSELLLLPRVFIAAPAP